MTTNRIPVWKSILKSLTKPVNSAMCYTVDDLRKFGVQALPVNQDRTEVRIKEWIIVLIFLLLTAEPIIYISRVNESLTWLVAGDPPGKYFYLASFLATFVGMLPHFITVSFLPQYMHVERLRVMAAVSAFASGATWLALATAAHKINLSWEVEWLYAIRSLVCIGFAFNFGYSVNAQQVREAMKQHATSVPAG